MERSTQRMVLLVATTAGFLSTFMASAINIALPRIEEEWNVSAVTLSWISLAYVLAAAALLMPAGRLADFYGRKRFFVIGMAAFTLLTLAAALAPSAPVLILLRVLQGIATAVLFSCTVAMVTLAYPPERRGRALGLQVGGVYLGLDSWSGVGWGDRPQPRMAVHLRLRRRGRRCQLRAGRLAAAGRRMARAEAHQLRRRRLGGCGRSG